jgi:hypothetical protein
LDLPDVIAMIALNLLARTVKGNPGIKQRIGQKAVFVIGFPMILPPQDKATNAVIGSLPPSFAMRL